MEEILPGILTSEEMSQLLSFFPNEQIEQLISRTLFLIDKTGNKEYEKLLNLFRNELVKRYEKNAEQKTNEPESELARMFK